MKTKHCAGARWRPRVSKARLVASVVVVLLLAGVARLVAQNQAGGDAVTLWNANAGVAATAACLAPLNNPLHESRIYAMMHVAIHDALNAIDRRSHPYALDVQADAGASPDAAVAAAARDVLVPLIAQLPLELHTQACIDAGVASVEAAYKRHSPRSPMVRRRRKVLPWDGPRLLPSSTSGPTTARLGHF